MGTEVRIGVLTGLLIVVVAGVYFFYGRNRDSQDLEIVTGKTPVVVPTIPSGRDVKPGATATRTTPVANATPRSNIPSNTPRPATTPNSGAAGSNAFRQPATPPAATNSMVASNGSKPAGSVVTPISANAGTAHIAPPSANSNTSPLASAQRPGTTDSSGVTPLRTAPSSALREATQRNLEGTGVKPALTDESTPNSGVANSGTIRLPDSLAPAGPKSTQPPTSNNGTTGPNAAGSTSTGTPKLSATTPTLAANTPNSGSANSTRPTVQPMNRPEEMKPTPLAKPITSTPPMQQAKPAQTWPRSHVIASGDTLSIISEKYYYTTQQVDRIMKANPSLNPRRLKIGDVVSIPAPDASIASDGNVAKTNPAERPSTGATIAAVNSATPSAPSAAGSRTYTVRSGDTLYSIAGKSLGDGKKWKQLFDKNRGVLKNDPKRLKAGMVLTLP